MEVTTERVARAIVELIEEHGLPLGNYVLICSLEGRMIRLDIDHGNYFMQKLIVEVRGDA